MSALLVIIMLMIALLPTIVIMTIVIKNARAAREPFSKLALVFGISAVSVIPAGLMEIFGGPVLETAMSLVGIRESGGELHQTVLAFLENILIVGGAEEACKFFTFKLMIFNDRDFDNTYDGVIYGACSALGFATIENLMYVFLLSEGAGLGVALLRAVLSVPLHAFTGIYMGYYFGITKYRRYNNLPDTHPERKAFLISAVVHGLYNSMLSIPQIYESTESILFAFGCLAIIMVFIYTHMAKTIKKAKTETRHIYNRYYYEHLSGQFQDMRGGKTSSLGAFIPPPPPPPFYGMSGMQNGRPMGSVPPPAMNMQGGSAAPNGPYAPYQTQQPMQPVPNDRYGDGQQPQFRQYAPAQTAPEPIPQPPVKSYRYCGSCGARHAETERFCGMCGSKLD